jgi:hypothetical protein
MAITLNGTTGITSPDINVTAQTTGFTTTGNLTAADLTLSGGVYLGGTGAANYLDDYEEGTFTPAVTSASYTMSSTYGAYTKIGRMVHVNLFVVFSAVNGSSTSSVAFNGLPFSSVQLNAGLYYPGVAREVSTSGGIFVVQQSRGLATFQMNSMDGVTSGSNQIFATGRNYTMSFSYLTA